MGILEEHKNQYLNNNIQFVLVNREGCVIESDNTIFGVEVYDNLTDYHPFFISLFTLFDTDKKKLIYRCVNLNLEQAEIIVDIKIEKFGEGVLVTIHNLTEHYEEYQSVAQGRNESIIKSELIVIKNKELEERERFKNEFIQNFSHELRNPLTSTITITNALDALRMPSEQKQMVEYLKDANSNLKLMIEDILNINMMASGKLVLRETIFDLHKLISVLNFSYDKKAKKKGINFFLSYDEKLPKHLEGDKLKLYQILTNLLENALKYTKEGSITLSVSLNQKRADKTNIRFLVLDTGIGIPEKSQKVIFDSFSRLDQSRNENGVGLGLAIVKGLVELMGGTIHVESKENHSSKFYFDLTFRYFLFENKQQRKPRQLQHKTQPKEGEKFRLLLVEDDNQIQMSIFKALANTGNFFIELVDDGAHVIQELINKKYDIILMDVNLPNTSGDVLTKLIRELPMNNLRKTPIIGLTSNAFEEQIRQYKKAGMNAVITKPFDVEELLETIFTLCKNSKK